MEKILTSGILLSSCEILDEVSIGVVKKAMNLRDSPGSQMHALYGDRRPPPGRAGSDPQIDAICQEVGGLGNEWSDDPAKRLVMWSARQGLVPSLSRVKPGYRQIPMVEDFGMPISQIRTRHSRNPGHRKKNNSPIATFGHIGDGNLHAVLSWMSAKRKSGRPCARSLRILST